MGVLSFFIAEVIKIFALGQLGCFVSLMTQEVGLVVGRLGEGDWDLVLDFTLLVDELLLALEPRLEIHFFILSLTIKKS